MSELHTIGVEDNSKGKKSERTVPILKIVNPFYKTSRWIKKRERILIRDGYQCQNSKRYGNTKTGNTVHHIYQLEKFPEIAFESWNLITLNTVVHNTFHNRTTGEVIGDGLIWQRKKKKDFENFYKSRNIEIPKI